MANIKFEECFLKNAEDFISVEDLQKVYEDHNGSYERHYFGNFYCPECYISQLSFHPNVQTPHFRSNGTHDEGCSFNFKPASKKQIEEYCNDIGNRNEINRKLKSCLDLLSRCNQQSITTNPLPHGKKTQATPNYFTVDIRSKRKSIRRKKLTTPLAEED